MFINPILACDFYKIGHKDQYPEGTEVIYSNFTPRSDRLAAKTRFYPDGIVFGGNITNKGYKVLDEHVGLIYGDSITLERAGEILQRLQRKGFASCNVVFGIGSYTYQYSTRDSFGQAMKATWA